MSRFSRLASHPSYAKAFHWGKLLTITGSAQVLIQIVGFISGILIIHLLPTEEYALYTLANAMLGTMTVLADGGIGSGVMAEGGKVWKEPEKLGSVLATGMNLRKMFAIGSLFIATPALFILLRHHQASMLMTLLIILSLIPAFWAALSDSLLEVAPKLNQNIVALQKNQVSVSIGRLLLITSSLFLFPWTFLAILGNGIPRIWGNFRLRKISSLYADWNQKSDPLVRQNILKIVKRTLPGTIYYCVSGQITIWLISIFGSTTSIAEVGALSRLAMLITLVNVLVSTLFEPRFARLPNKKSVILLRLFQIQGGLILLGLLIVFFVWMFPHQVLFILGKDYANLTNEVLLLAIGSCIGMISGSIYKLSSVRGIVPPPIVLIPVIIAIQVIVGLLVDFSQVKGALEFTIFTFLAAWAFRMGYFLLSIYKNIKE